MFNRRYPIGVQTFHKIIEGGYAYVDKTKYIKPIIFQTGYLSIDSYDKESQLYTLRFPNREVEIGFYRNL